VNNSGAYNLSVKQNAGKRTSRAWDMRILQIIRELWDRLSGRSKQEEEALKSALYHSNYSLTWNGHEIGHMSGMYIPDQFWKHYKMTITTEDKDTQQRMLNDESFWDEPFVLIREVDGAKRYVNGDSLTPIIAGSSAARLREQGEIAFRAL